MQFFYYKTCLDLCCPSRDEQQALLQKKSEDFRNDAIVRSASEHLSAQEEKPATSKKNIKVPSGYLIAHLQEHRKSVNR